MRDVVQYYMWRLPGGVTPRILDNPADPARKLYLARFADQEGKLFLGRFWEKYRGEPPDQALNTLAGGIHATPKRLAVIFRSVKPEAGVEQFAAFLKAHPTGIAVAPGEVEDLYKEYGPDKFNLNDRGYLARVHPLELWLLAYLQAHPKASLDEIDAASAVPRQEVYQWLFKDGREHAQDVRIRTLLEQDAFVPILRSWKQQGYPFDDMVPSYASALGSSGDNPEALATLVGIVLNGGVRYPGIRVRELHFAKDTPFDTVLTRTPRPGERIFPRELAQAVKQELIGVVDQGTGRRAYHSVALPGGTILPVGGKTGTGDNRFLVFAPGGREIASRVVNRTGTFVFLVGDRFFGAVTAYVPGPEAARFKFTSALPVQMFRRLAPALMPLIEREKERPLPAEH